MLSAGAVGAFAISWFALQKFNPGYAFKQTEGMLLLGEILATVLARLPLTVWAILHIVGWFLPPAALGSTFAIRVATPRAEVWAARMAMERVPEYGESFCTVERLHDTGQET